jgi:hypothetical protein
MPEVIKFEVIQSDIDLRLNPLAGDYVKDELVTVQFAQSAGTVSSREGANRYAVGDALITGSTGDHWSVSRERFDMRYLPETGTRHGQDGPYRNRALIVLAIQQPKSFSVERSAGGDVIEGQAQDWLLQYAPGDHGIVANRKFQRLYRVVASELKQANAQVPNQT